MRVPKPGDGQHSLRQPAAHSLRSSGLSERVKARMAAAIDEPAPILERFATLLLNGLFGLGLIARDQNGKASSLRQGAGSFGSLSFIIASLIEAGQMLAFPFSAIQHIWDGTVIRNFVVPMLTVVMPASADVWFGPMVYRVSAPCSFAACGCPAAGRLRHLQAAQLALLRNAISCGFRMPPIVA